MTCTPNIIKITFLFYILFLYKKYKYFVFHVFIFCNTNITNQVLGDAENKTLKATLTMGYYDN